MFFRWRKESSMEQLAQDLQSFAAEKPRRKLHENSADPSMQRSPRRPLNCRSNLIGGHFYLEKEFSLLAPRLILSQPE